MIYHEAHFIFVTAMVSFFFGCLQEKTKLNSWNICYCLARIFSLLVCYLKAYRYNSILISLYTTVLIIKNDNYQFLTRRHVSAKYSHHQTNIASTFRYIKYAFNGIPLCLQYCSRYPCNSM